ncbi:hypothetical protein HT585_13015 [Ensifer sp. HO-A22]|uniref:Uncharacterized protein n=1 Tax=Ensifer oleiphilus TaxID=2742698 RepID=A0A7Y6UNM6_9HYPH|nr:hypothetical protein [Ensifer oleiphilus]NVD39783.1 hypothetical protein [Ensifer oleiphilus]
MANFDQIIDGLEVRVGNLFPMRRQPHHQVIATDILEFDSLRLSPTVEKDWPTKTKVAT